MTADGPQRIRALRAFAYSLDGVLLIAVAPGEEVSLRSGAAAGLVAEGYAEPVQPIAVSEPPAPLDAPAPAPLPPPEPADLLTTTVPIPGDAHVPRRRRAPDRRTS